MVVTKYSALDKAKHRNCYMAKTSLNIIYLLIFTLFLSCDKKYISFDEYIKNDNIFSGKKLLENKIFTIENEARIIYDEEGTFFSIYDNPDESKILFKLKYRTKIIPLEIISFNGNLWVKIKTKDDRIGWIKSCYIELYKRSVKKR
jgi:hypothetical protein